MQESIRWYAVYTKSRQEKALTARLLAKGIEAWIPLHKTLRQWSDRKKMVEEPLIRSYVFVKILPMQYDDVLHTPGAVRYIWFGGGPAAIPDIQMDLLKTIAGAGVETEVISSNLKPGLPVKIIAGPLSGLTGELVYHAGRNRVIVRIDHLEQVISLSVPAGLVEVRVTK